MNRFRFSVRTLCIVVALAAIACALVFRWEPFRSRLLLAQLQSAGVEEVWFDPTWRGDKDGLRTIFMTVSKSTQFDRVRVALPSDCAAHLSWNNTATSAGWVKEICQIENPATLNLQHADITDLDIAGLATMRRLEVLKVQSSKVTDKSIPHFKSMPSLRRLDLINTKITPAGFEELGNAGIEISERSWNYDPGF